MASSAVQCVRCCSQEQHNSIQTTLRSSHFYHMVHPAHLDVHRGLAVIHPAHLEVLLVLLLQQPPQVVHVIVMEVANFAA